MAAAGEQITSGLLALALQSRGVTARSWLGWADPDPHGRRPRPRQDREHRDGRVAAAHRAPGGAGRRRFSGPRAARADHDPRPGAAPIPRRWRWPRRWAPTAATSSPTWKVCFTADPRIVATARKLNKITYRRKCWSSPPSGAKVLQIRAVEMAMKHQVPLQVASSFTDAPGTFVVDEDDIVEQERVSGIAYSRDEAKITVMGCGRPPRRRGAHLRAPGGRQRQRRHDRAEYLCRRHDRPHVYGDGGPTSSAPSPSSRRPGAPSRTSGWWRTGAWSRSR